MLDKLVVSKDSTKENRRTGNFIITSFLAMVSVLTVGLVYSLFTYNLAMGNENLTISTLIAPVPEMEIKPEPPKEEIKPEQKTNQTNLISRKTNTQRLDESPVKPPAKISVNKSNVIARPKGAFKVDDFDSPANFTPSGVSGSRNENGGTSIGGGNSGNNSDTQVIIPKPEIEKPPALKKEPKPEVEKIRGPVSGGVVNGKAISLVQPNYSSAARAINAGGKVTVQVLIDEDGKVISAKAVNGHPLLIQSAIRAAKASKFSPTLLSNKKVQVSGVIIYNFIK
jgi:TonB family protein